jgi:hypothetical protein
MAVARYLDPEPQVQPQLVNINSQGMASPAGVSIANGQPVQFNNNSGTTISITFANTAVSNQRVFNDIASLGPGQSTTESPLINDKTVNYTLSIGTNGPFAIEVGVGPMEISVTSELPNPLVAVIPPNGEVQFTATDNQCDIHWENNNDPFNPPLNTVYVGQSNNQIGQEQGNSAANFGYTLGDIVADEAGGDGVGGGGGTIKVT